MSFFNAPLQVGDTNDRVTAGWVVASQSTVVSGADATTALFSIQKPYNIIEIFVDVNTAYTASATMDIGITGTLDKFADALDVDAVGRVLASSDASQLVNWYDATSGGKEDIIATLTGASAGSGRVTIIYATPITLSN